MSWRLLTRLWSGATKAEGERKKRKVETSDTSLVRGNQEKRGGRIYLRVVEMLMGLGRSAQQVRYRVRCKYWVGVKLQ